jgi:3-oxoacyl-(acyl-carrier-protein) synthase
MSPLPPKPLSAEREGEGLMLGEGAACLLLCRADTWTEGVFVKGVGLANDARHATAPDREGRGAARAMLAALDDADMRPDEVSAISLHATGTAFNDAMEAHAVARVFPHGCPPLHCCKQVTGHTLGAAGAIEAVLAAQIVEDGVLPRGPATLDPALPWPAIRLPGPVTSVLSTSSAFVGHRPGRLRPERPVARSEAVQVQIGAGPQRWTALWPDAPRRVLRTHRFVRVGLLAVHRLMEAVGPFEPATGVVIAGPSGCLAVDTRFYRRVLEEGPANASRVDFAATVCTAPAAEAAILWGLTGPTIGFVGHDTDAAVEAAAVIRSGRARAMIALTVDCPPDDAPAWARAELLWDPDA